MEALVKQTKKLSENTEVIVHGDMQNWYPCDEGISCDKVDQIGLVSKQNAGGANSFLGKFTKEKDSQGEFTTDLGAIAKKIHDKLKAADVKDVGAWQTKDAKARPSLADSLTHPLTHSPTESLTHSLTHSLTLSVLQWCSGNWSPVNDPTQTLRLTGWHW